jgi:elongation factor P--beta-lysine ligase
LYFTQGCVTEIPRVHMVLRACIGMNRFVREYHALLNVILKQTELADISFQQIFTRKDPGQDKNKSVENQVKYNK